MQTFIRFPAGFKDMKMHQNLPSSTRGGRQEDRNSRDSRLSIVLHDLRSKIESDAHVEPTKELVQVTNETWKVQQLNCQNLQQTDLMILLSNESETTQS